MCQTLCLPPPCDTKVKKDVTPKSLSGRCGGVEAEHTVHIIQVIPSRHHVNLLNWSSQCLKLSVERSPFLKHTLVFLREIVAFLGERRKHCV